MSKGQHSGDKIRRKTLASQGRLNLRPESLDEDWVAETRFGKWFLSTDTWVRYVLGDALNTLFDLLDDDAPKGMHLVDVGCGQGRAFTLLDDAFKPRSIVGVDMDPELIERAAIAAERGRCEIRCIHASAARLPFPSASCDLVFCHQLLHHMHAQQNALREFHRVLVPGGRLLVAESCRSFIESSAVRALFRHPMAAQKTAGEYLAMMRWRFWLRHYG